MSLFEGNKDSWHIPTQARQVYDVTGAGDTVVGTLALALSIGASMREAATLANHAAGIVVGMVGTATVTTKQLIGGAWRLTKPKPQVTVVIPARYGSSRFPGKPIAMLGQKPIIQHVYEQAAACRAVSEVVGRHRRSNGFGRRSSSSVDRRCDNHGDFGAGPIVSLPWRGLRAGSFFLNLQGDEIPIDPELLTDLIEPFVESGAEMGTLKRTLHSAEDLQNPAVVKVVTDQQGRALYFSRAPIPLVRDDPRHGRP